MDHSTANSGDGAAVLARLDRIPVWPHTHRAFLGLLATYFFVAFDLVAIGPALPVVGEDFHVGLGSLTLVGTLSLLGYIPGALLTSYVSDRYGRRPALVAAVILMVAGSLGRALSPDIGVFYVASLVAGAGGGGGIEVIVTTVMEISPSPLRGKYTARAVLSSFVGSVITISIALGLVDDISIGWRYYLAIPVLSAVSLAVAWPTLPDSPRWLVEHGRVDDAARVVEVAELRAARRLKLPDVRSLPEVPAPEEPLPARQVAAGTGNKKPARSGLGAFLSSTLPLFLPPTLKYTLLLFVTWFLQYLPTYAISTVGIAILVKIGYSLQNSTLITLGASAAGAVTCLALGQISDRVERKWLISGASLIMTALGIAIAIHVDTAMVVIVTIFLNVTGAVFYSLFYVTTAEHFPTVIRNRGIALTEGVGHTGGVAGPSVATTALVAWGFSGMWELFAGLFAILSVLVLLTRSSKGTQLEEMHPTDEISATPRVVPDGNSAAL